MGYLKDLTPFQRSCDFWEAKRNYEVRIKRIIKYILSVLLLQQGKRPPSSDALNSIRFSPEVQIKGDEKRDVRVEQAVNNFLDLFEEFRDEVREEFDLTFDQIRDIFYTIKCIFPNMGEDEIGALYHKKALENSVWFSQGLYFIKIGKDKYKAVVISVLNVLAFRAFACVQANIEKNIFNKSIIDAFILWAQKNKKNRINPEASYLKSRSKYKSLTWGILVIGLSLARERVRQQRSPRRLNFLLKIYPFHTKYSHLACVFYPIKQEGKKFYDCLGSEISYETALASRCAIKFVDDLTIASDDPSLDKIEKELSLGFEKFKIKPDLRFAEIVEKNCADPA